jgi:thiamine-phosphate pyrophosphorylase
MLAELTTDSAQRLDECDRQPSRVNHVVVGHIEGAPESRRERRLEPARFARPEPGHVEAEALADAKLVFEPLRFVAVARGDQRAAAQISGVDSARVSELVNKPWVRLRRGDPEPEQRLLPGVCLGDRGEHPGGDARCSASRFVPLQHRHVQPVLSEAPSGGEANHPATHDDHIEVRHRLMLAMVACQTCHVIDRRDRLQQARLYLVCDERSDEFLEAALRGGVDVVQLRLKDSIDAEIIAAARRFARVCAAHGALFILNDRPDLVLEAGADGVHLGQDDAPVAQAQTQIGADRLVGLSTHSPAQIDAATNVDYIGVGPVHETPTKPGRKAVGLELVRYAAAHGRVPFFAIGGIDATNVDAVTAAGAQRVAVVRALTEAQDPERTARDLRAALTAEVGVGAA